MKSFGSLLAISIGLVTATSNLRAEPLSAEANYAAHCARCHGAERKGRIGVPNLSDKIWNWSGDVASIETTIRYGIRSKDAKTRAGVMPGFKHNDAELSDENIGDLIAYLNQLAGKKVDAAAVERAKENWVWCVDCHGDQGQGKQEIGAPKLTDHDWLYGGDKKSIATSIGEGRAGVCPGGAGKLDEPSIHALAVWLVAGAK